MKRCHIDYVVHDILKPVVVVVKFNCPCPQYLNLLTLQTYCINSRVVSLCFSTTGLGGISVPLLQLPECSMKIFSVWQLRWASRLAITTWWAGTGYCKTMQCNRCTNGVILDTVLVLAQQIYCIKRTGSINQCNIYGG